MTDHWEAYKLFLPTEKHVQPKAETYTVEGYNSLFRQFLARMRRKTKCYGTLSNQIIDGKMEWSTSYAKLAMQKYV